MTKILRISEATSLAFHTAVLLAKNPERPLTVTSVASLLDVSEAHLSKVMQRLAKANLVHAIRGPKGGYRLQRSPGAITLLDIYETIEGPFTQTECLLGTPICGGNDCILGNLPNLINGKVRDYLSGTRLVDLIGVYDGVE